MTFPNEKAEIRAHEIEKTKAEIKVLEAKLSFLEEMEKHKKSPAEEAFKGVYYRYPDKLDDKYGSAWDIFEKGYNAAKEEKVSKYQPTPQTQEEVEKPVYTVDVEKLKESNWYIDAKTLLKSNWEPKPQNEKEVAQGLRDAMKTAKAEGVFDEPEPETLTLKNLLKKWEFNFAFKWENPKNRSSELYEEEVERFIQMFEEWLPDAIVTDIGRSELWTGGYNAYRKILMGKLK